MFKETIELKWHYINVTFRLFRACVQFYISFGFGPGLGLCFRIRTQSILPIYNSTTELFPKNDSIFCNLEQACSHWSKGFAPFLAAFFFYGIKFFRNLCHCCSLLMISSSGKSGKRFGLVLHRGSQTGVHVHPHGYISTFQRVAQSRLKIIKNTFGQIKIPSKTKILFLTKILFCQNRIFIFNWIFIAQ